MEEVNLILDDTEERMDKSIQFLISELKKIRAGKATPNMLESVMVEYYGTATPLIQVASITTPDSRTLFIKPWEKTIIQDIEKSIQNSDLGLTPQNDGDNVIINIPPLTEERRLNLVKQIKNEGEKGKISIRSVRKESNEYLKKLSKEGVSEDAIRDAETEIQKITDDKIKELQKTEEIFLSPLFKKKTNQQLNIFRYLKLRATTKMNDISLGGINNKNLKKLNMIKPFGFAAISYFE